MILASTSYAPLGSDFEVWTKNDKHTPKPAKGNKFIIALEELAEGAHIMPGFFINSTQRTIIFDQVKNKYICPRTKVLIIKTKEYMKKSICDLSCNQKVNQNVSTSSIVIY